MNKQISAVEASILRKDEEAVLLDVREPSELAICAIEGAVLKYSQNVEAKVLCRRLFLADEHGDRAPWLQQSGLFGDSV